MLYCARMTLDTALRAVSAAAMLVVVVVGVLVLQTRHEGRLQVTATQKIVGIGAAAVGLMATALALFT